MDTGIRQEAGALKKIVDEDVATLNMANFIRWGMGALLVIGIAGGFIIFADRET